MIEIFKKNLFINSLLLLPYAVVLRVHTLIYPELTTDLASNDIQAYLLNLFSSPLSQSIAAILLVFLQGVYLNRIIITNRLGSGITLLPGLFYILMMSFLPDYSYYSLALIANTFILLFLGKTFKTYNRPKAADLVFDIGLYIGLASIIYWPSILFVIAAYASISLLRSIKWSDRVQFLSGLIIPYFLWWTYRFYFSDSGDHVLTYLGGSQRILLTIQSDFSSYLYIILMILLALYFISQYSTYVSKKSIQVQKKVDILYWVMLCAGLGLLYANQNSFQALFLMIPIGFFISQSILKIKNSLTAELIHLSMVVLLFLLHFGFIETILNSR